MYDLLCLMITFYWESRYSVLVSARSFLYKQRENLSKTLIRGLFWVVLNVKFHYCLLLVRITHNYSEFFSK